MNTVEFNRPAPLAGMPDFVAGASRLMVQQRRLFARLFSARAHQYQPALREVPRWELETWCAAFADAVDAQLRGRTIPAGQATAAVAERLEGSWAAVDEVIVSTLREVVDATVSAPALAAWNHAARGAQAALRRGAAAPLGA